jgi:hypothetical protein
MHLPATIVSFRASHDTGKDAGVRQFDIFEVPGLPGLGDLRNAKYIAGVGVALFQQIYPPGELIVSCRLLYGCFTKSVSGIMRTLL